MDSTALLSEAHPLITDQRSSGNGLSISCRVYSPEFAEVTALKLTYEDSLKKGGGAKRKNDTKESMDYSTLYKSLARAKTTIKRKTLALQADHLLTCTFRENVTDIEEAWRVFKYFARLMRENFEHFAYVCVPERQKRGAIHFHLAVHGRYNVRVVRHFWRRAAGKYEGNIDISDPNKHIGKHNWNPKRIANYIKKYISKTDIVDFNKKRYSTGGSIQVPEPMRGWVALGLCVEQLLSKVLQHYTHKPHDEYFEFESYFKGYYAAT